MVKAVAVCISVPTAQEVKTDFKTVSLAPSLHPVPTPMMLDSTAQHVRTRVYINFVIAIYQALNVYKQHFCNVNMYVCP